MGFRIKLLLKLKDGDKINHAAAHVLNDYSGSKTISVVLKEIKAENKYSSENELKGKVHEFLKKHLVFSDYKFNLYYYLHIFFLEDSTNEFFKRCKYCFIY